MTNTNQDAKYIQMTTVPVEKLILKFSFPTIISMLITTLYNLADTFYVKQLSNDSMIAAIGVVLPLMTIIQAFGFFFGHGSGNYISRGLGKGEKEDTEKMASCGFFYSIMLGLIIMGLCFISRKGIAIILGAKTAQTIEASVDYMTYILIATPFMMGAIVLNNQLRLQGNAMYAMVGLTTGGILNMILDPLFIYSGGDVILDGSITIPFGLGMGISGAALATAISQFISFIILSIMSELSDNVKIRIKKFSFDKKYVKGIIQGGLPSLARQGVATIATTCLNHSIGIYVIGDKLIDATQAAMTGSFKIVNFTCALLLGFGQGFQPVCGFNYGAGKYDRVIKAYHFCIKLAFFALLAVSALAFIFAKPISSAVIGSSPEVVEIAVVALRAQYIVFPLMSYVILCNMMLQTIGRTVPATAVSIIRQGVAFIPIVFLLPLLLRLLGVEPVLGIQISQPISDLVSVAVAIPLGIREIRLMKKAMNEMK